LEAIEPALVRAFAEREQFELRIVADLPPNLPALDPDRVSFQSWSEVTEVAELQQFDIGLMPLEDNLWARGKCSFKMLQYMACQIPVVVSPVGMNAQVLSHGAVGFAAKSADDWTDSLIALADSAAVRQRMGEQGRRVVEHNYAVDVLAPRFARLLEEVRP
jgi:glycosyltransferase involved in cell wall biosynthesis